MAVGLVRRGSKIESSWLALAKFKHHSVFWWELLRCFWLQERMCTCYVFEPYKETASLRLMSLLAIC
jgi:hypothetical protein